MAKKKEFIVEVNMNEKTTIDPVIKVDLPDEITIECKKKYDYGNSLEFSVYYHYAQAEPVDTEIDPVDLVKILRDFADSVEKIFVKGESK